MGWSASIHQRCHKQIQDFVAPFTLALVRPLPLLRLTAPCDAHHESTVNGRIVPFLLDVLGEDLGLLRGPSKHRVPDIVDVTCGSLLASISDSSIQGRIGRWQCHFESFAFSLCRSTTNLRCPIQQQACTRDPFRWPSCPGANYHLRSGSQYP